METYGTEQEMLAQLFQEMLALEKRAVITGDFRDISSNDMHIIEAIGMDTSSNMSTIAKRLSITVGALTTAMNALVKKAYVMRERSEVDRRVVYIELTEKGKSAYIHLQDFNFQMMRAAVENITPDELPVLIRTLTNLVRFFRKHGDAEEDRQ